MASMIAPGLRNGIYIAFPLFTRTPIVILANGQ